MNRFQDGDTLPITEKIQNPISAADASSRLLFHQDYYNEFFYKSPVATALLDNDDRVMEINQAFHHLFGYTPEETLGRPINQLVAYKIVTAEAELVSSDSISGNVVSLESVRFHKDGEGISVGILAYPVYSRDRKIAVYVSYTDIRERRIYERQLSVFSRILEKSTEAVCIFNVNGTIQWVNKTFHDLIGPYEDQWNETLSSLMVIQPEVYEEIMQDLKSGNSWKRDTQATGLNGSTFPAWINAFCLDSDDPENPEYVMLINDISDLRQKEEKLDYLSSKDALTGLNNRIHFIETFKTMVMGADADDEIALLFIDLNDFKLINENNSHATGDEILRYAAALLQSSLRDSDILARYGGDEFVIALKGKKADSVSRRVFTRIFEKLKKPIFINDLELNITVSIGIAFYPQDGLDGNALIRHAEMAMYDAKRERNNSVQYYDVNLRESVRDAFIMKNSLRNAVRDSEIYLAYQPVVDTSTGKILGVEALARWLSPRLGQVPPDRFIPVAEEADLIGEIGQWIILEACKQQVILQEQGYPDLFMAVNVSVKQLESSNFTEIVRHALSESGIKPSNLEIEVTESIQVNNTEACIDQLNQLKALGLTISMDDFGTGYSSLAQLSRLPLDKLKIDRSFIVDFESNIPLIGIIMAMANSLRLKVVAEGVETEKQYLCLKECQCDFVQGYYFSKPLSPEDLLIRLQENRAEEGTL